MFSMRRAHWIPILAAALVLAPCLATVLSAQDEPLKANIVVSLSVTNRAGTSHVTVSGNDQLKIGDSRTSYYYSSANGASSGGSDNQPLSSREWKGVTVMAGIVDGRPEMSRIQGPPPAWMRQYDYFWKVDVKPVSIAPDGIAFEIDWQRGEFKDGAMVATLRDHRVVTLRQGEKHLLDFVACAPPDGPNANVFLEARASIAEDPAFADAAFDYDLWLTHQTFDGRKITRHAIVGGRQGERVGFGFASIPLPLDASAPAEAASPYRLDVSGAITGRLRSDGTVQLALEPMRQQSFDGGRGGYGAGIKVFTVRPDETTIVALPAGTGASTFKTDLASKLTNPRPGVTAKDGRVSVNDAAFFEGTTTSILITVKRQRQD
jgi:hypothetical protein